MFSRHRYAQPVLLVVCALTGVLFALGVTGGAGASLVWNGDFETGNFSQYASTTYCVASWSCQVVAAPGGPAGDAARFEVRSGDTSPYGGDRSEVQVNSDETIGSESWWHFEVYLPSDFTDSSSFWQSLIDWHHYQLGGGNCNCATSTPLSIQEIKGSYVLRIVNSADISQASYWTQYALGPAVRGAWTSFDFHAKWSDDPTVAVEDVYVNGTQVQHITGHPNEFTGYFNYLKLGFYRAAEPITQVVYFDNVRRATNLADAEGSSWASNTTSTSSTSTTTTASTTTTTPTSWATTTTPTTSTTSSTTTTTSPATSTLQTTTSTAPPPPAYKVSITSPAAGANLTGRVTWTATTSGATTSEVDFFIDGNQKWTEYWPPYYFGDNQYWDTTSVKNGSHTLMVRAISSTGLVTTSSINVTVNNPRRSLYKAS